jgi:hypothetical protein
MTHEELVGMIIQQRIRRYESQVERDKEAETSVDPDSDFEEGLVAPTIPESPDPRWVTAGSGSRMSLADASQGMLPEYLPAFNDLAAKLTRKIRTDLSVRGRAWSVSGTTMVRCIGLNRVEVGI